MNTRSGIFRRILRTDPTSAIADAVKLRLECGHTTIRPKRTITPNQRRVRCTICEIQRDQESKR